MARALETLGLEFEQDLNRVQRIPFSEPELADLPASLFTYMFAQPETSRMTAATAIQRHAANCGLRSWSTSDSDCSWICPDRRTPPENHPALHQTGEGCGLWADASCLNANGTVSPVSANGFFLGFC